MEFMNKVRDVADAVGFCGPGKGDMLLMVLDEWPEVHCGLHFSSA